MGHQYFYTDYCEIDFHFSVFVKTSLGLPIFYTEKKESTAFSVNVYGGQTGVKNSRGQN